MTWREPILDWKNSDMTFAEIAAFAREALASAAALDGFLRPTRVTEIVQRATQWLGPRADDSAE